MTQFQVDYKDDSSETISADVADFRGDLLVFFRRVRIADSASSDDRQDVLSVITTRPSGTVAKVEDIGPVAW